MIQRPHKAYPVELAQFHSADYVEFLNRITPDTQHLFLNELTKCMLFTVLNSFRCDFKFFVMKRKHITCNGYDATWLQG